MVDDGDLRQAERVMWHLGQVEKTYKIDKHKSAQDLLLQQSLQGGSEYMRAVQRYRDDAKVLETFTAEATMLLQGHASRVRYNLCLGRSFSCSMFW